MFIDEDSYWHKGLRKRLIDELRQAGIQDEKVLEAMMNVPRHLFLDSALIQYAYENKALPIECEQTISHPFTVAYQTQLLNLKKSEKILEIGTGSGYQCIILAALKANVYSIERQKSLHQKFLTHSLLKKYNNIKCFYGDGYKGLSAYAPFDKILITAGLTGVPEKLLEQLKIGGVMVAPIDVENGTEQVMKKIIKTSASSFEITSYEKFSFVPMLTGKKIN